ncbi:MAG TPA: type IV-A pilus assembly ATPase PilB [Gammaproteobacteria bacterium]|nr:type IV-A pilus assembly ATPase PilB [Gammaproteobacteria bacterium]
MNKQTEQPKLVRALVNLGIITAEGALKVSESGNSPQKLFEELHTKGIASPRKIAREFSNTFGSPRVDLSAFDATLFPTSTINAKLLESHFVLPLAQKGQKLYVAIANPTNNTALSEIQFATGLQVVPIITDWQNLAAGTAAYHDAQGGTLEEYLGDTDIELDLAEDDEEEANDPIGFDPNEAPIVKYVNKVLVDAINRGASDIHIEPFEHELRIRFRIDGILHIITSQPINLAPRIIARIKIISKLDIAERRAPQDGRVKLKISKSKSFDFRVNTLPTVYGEKVVMRILDSSSANLDLNILGFTKEQLEQYTNVINQPYGMVLITGPTGSGKTVTLYSALNKINDPTKNICTVEDPVEIQLAGITQVNINERANLNFASALRAFLRQDPDIIMLGEIRDLETAEIAIKASQTGHMVFSTLHTNDAPATLTRLLNMGVPAFNVASAVSLIVAQRLARTLCKSCKVETEITEPALIDFGFTPEQIKEHKIYDPNFDGCPKCTLGYKGRAGLFQVMELSKKMKRLIMEGCTERDIEQAAIEDGVMDLRHAGMQKILDGITSVAEIERVTNV